MKHFSLFSEPWIPIVENDRKSLKQVFTDSSLNQIGGSATEKIAIFKFLLAIAQCAYTPKNEEEWLAIGSSGLAQKVLSYLRKHEQSFDLYGEKPFMQILGARKATLKPFATIVPEIASGNTTVLTHAQVARHFSDADKAVYLLTLQSFAMGGKKTDNSVVLTPNYKGKLNPKGKPSTGKSGPALEFCGLLHSFVFGDSLWESLWLNLWTEEFLNQDKQRVLYPTGLGTPPWESMPHGEDCPVARSYRESLIGRLIPLSRYCLIEEQQIHLTEGIKYDGYKEGKFDPTAAVMMSNKGPRALWVDPEKRPWRELTALLNQEHNGNGFECQQVQMFLMHRSTLEQVCPDRRVTFWSGGLRVSSNAGEQYVSGTDDYIESAVELGLSYFGRNWFVEFSNQMIELEQRSKQLYGSIQQYQKGMGLADNKAAAFGVNQFWMRSESNCQKLLDACDEDAGTKEQLLSELQNDFYLKACQIYDEICPNTTARQMQCWVKSRPTRRLKRKK